MGAMLAIVEKAERQTATRVEVALWDGMLRLGASMMTLFFAYQAARWPVGLRYAVGGVVHEVEGADRVEIGTKFGKVSVDQPVGREARRRRSPKDRPMARALDLPGGSRCTWSLWSRSSAR
jgi:hypothetical protein